VVRVPRGLVHAGGGFRWVWWRWMWLKWRCV
jgi:hypothetical protein